MVVVVRIITTKRTIANLGIVDVVIYIDEVTADYAKLRIKPESEGFKVASAE